MNQRPGVMIYFEILPTLQNLSKADKAVLFEAILEYGMYKTLPQMSAKLKVIWPLVQQRLDWDEEKYYQVVSKRAYSAYVRWAKHNDEPYVDFKTWKAQNGEGLSAKDYEEAMISKTE